METITTQYDSFNKDLIIRMSPNKRWLETVHYLLHV